MRRCARRAGQLHVPWHAVHLDTPALRRRPEASRQPPLRALKLAGALGATTATPSGTNAAVALVRCAREHNLARLTSSNPLTPVS